MIGSPLKTRVIFPCYHFNLHAVSQRMPLRLKKTSLFRHFCRPTACSQPAVLTDLLRHCLKQTACTLPHGSSSLTDPALTEALHPYFGSAALRPSSAAPLTIRFHQPGLSVIIPSAYSSLHSLCFILLLSKRYSLV